MIRIIGQPEPRRCRVNDVRARLGGQPAGARALGSAADAVRVTERRTEACALPGWLLTVQAAAAAACQWPGGLRGRFRVAARGRQLERSSQRSFSLSGPKYKRQVPSPNGTSQAQKFRAGAAAPGPRAHSVAESPSQLGSLRSSNDLERSW
jgi:hypothetical protein